MSIIFVYAYIEIIQCSYIYISAWINFCTSKTPLPAHRKVIWLCIIRSNMLLLMTKIHNWSQTTSSIVIDVPVNTMAQKKSTTSRFIDCFVRYVFRNWYLYNTRLRQCMFKVVVVYNENPCAWLLWHWSSRGQLHFATHEAVKPSGF